MIEICVDADKQAAIAQWVSDRLPFPVRFKDFQAIGLLRSNKMVAGLIYQNFVQDAITGEPIMVECAMAADSARWISRDAIAIGLRYPFLVLGVRRLNCYTGRTNTRTRKMLVGLGFKLEGCLAAAMTGGDDAMIYGLMRADAQKWLREDDGKR